MRRTFSFVQVGAPARRGNSLARRAAKSAPTSIQLQCGGSRAGKFGERRTRARVAGRGQRRLVGRKDETPFSPLLQRGRSGFGRRIAQCRGPLGIAPVAPAPPLANELGMAFSDRIA